MSVVANVAINVDASKALQQIKSVDTAADNLAKSAAAIPSKIGGGIDALGGKMQALGSKFATLGGAIASLGAGAALKGVLDAGIAADRTGKTIQALAGSYKEVAGVNKIANEAAKEFGISQTTAAKSVADLYGRLRPMGVSLEDIGKTFNGVNKAAGLMNLTSADTEGVMLQLSQAMGSGKLQGDELRSVMERLPAVGQAVAKAMGVSVGEIKQLGADGKITTDIIIKAMDELNKLKPPPPDAVKEYSAAVEDLQTSIGTKLLPAFTPLLEKLTALIEKFGALPQPVQNIVIGIGAFIAVLALVAAPLGFLISGIGSLVGALTAANIGGIIAGWAAAAGPAITAITAAFSGLLTWLTGTLLPGLLAFFSGPAGWTVLAVAAVVAMCIFFQEPINEFFIWLNEAFVNGIDAIWEWGEPIRKFWVDLWTGAQEITGDFLKWLGNEFEYAMKALGQLGYDLFLKPWVDLWNNQLSPAVEKAVKLIQSLWRGLAEFWQKNVAEPVGQAWNKLTQFLPQAMDTCAKTIKSVFTQVGTTIKGILNGILKGIFNAVNGAINNINYLIKKANELSAKVQGPQLPILPKLEIPQFANGGVVSGPTLAMVGEGGEPEYIIPQSKMAKASANYLNGARGAAVIPAYASGGYVGSGNAQINVTTGPVLQQGGQQYVTMADLEKAMRQTANGVYASLRTPAGRYAMGVR